FVRNQCERHYRIIGQLYGVSVVINVQLSLKNLLCGLANGLEEITCVKSRRVRSGVKHALCCRHGGDASACLLKYFSRLGTLCPSRRTLQQRMQHLHVVLDAMIELTQENALQSLRLFALTDVHQHVYRADNLSGAVAQRCRIWNERNP